MTTNTIPAMPATNCPTFCTEDHAGEWERHAGICMGTWSIPMEDGTRSHHEPETLEKTVADFEPLHLHRIFYLELGGSECVRVDVQQCTGDDEACLYVDAGGVVTVEQARAFAAALLNAADLFEAL